MFSKRQTNKKKVMHNIIIIKNMKKNAIKKNVDATYENGNSIPVGQLCGTRRDASGADNTVIVIYH